MQFPMNRILANIQKRLQKIDKALRISFSNLKLDISIHANSLELLNSKIAEQERLIEQLIIEMAVLKEQRHDIKTESEPPTEQRVFGERSVSSVDRSVAVLRTPNSLSALHLEILKRIMLLQMETGKRCITMREIAAEVYPTKEYSRIKSTMSEYIKSLHQSGLVEKVQKEKLYLSYTEKALQYADEQRISRMKEIISAPIQTVR
jgi:hypothetical protein